MEISSDPNRKNLVLSGRSLYAEQSVSLSQRPILLSREVDPITPSIIEGEIRSLDRYYRVLRRHRKLIIGLFSSAVLAALIVAAILPRRYTATSTILIEPREPQALSLKDLSADSQDTSDDDYYYETQYQILQSRTLAHQVIHELGLSHVKWFTASAQKTSFVGSLLSMFASHTVPSTGESLEKSPLFESRLIDSYLKELSVKPEQRSRLVAVSFTSNDPRLSETIVNAHVRAYIRRAFRDSRGYESGCGGFSE